MSAFIENSPRLPWAIGPPASPNKVGPLVKVSGVPFDDGLAHNDPEATPDKNYSARAFLTTLAG